MSDFRNEDEPEEHFRLAGVEWAELESAAQILEDTKSAVLAQRQIAMGDMAVSKSEMLVKSTLSWQEHVEEICAARERANKARVEWDYRRMKFDRWKNEQIRAHAEMKL